MQYRVRKRKRPRGSRRFEEELEERQQQAQRGLQEEILFLSEYSDIDEARLTIAIKAIENVIYF